MRVLWHISDPGGAYAGRYIAEGYRDAFIDLGHEFHFLVRGESFSEVYRRVRPDLFFTFIDDEYFDSLDLDLLTRERAAGRTSVFAFVHPLKQIAPGLPGMAAAAHKIDAMRRGRYADFYHSYFEEWLMRDFEAVTGQRYWKLPLAANRLRHYPVEPDPSMSCDVAFVGAYLPEKRQVFDRLLRPLRKRYRVRIHGRDWTPVDRAAGWIEGRVRWHTGIPLRLRRPPLSYFDERVLYSSARISLNFHLDFQARLGADLNERTFRIPACGGFELCDWNQAVRAFFSADEVVMAEGPEDWLAKVDHLLHADSERERVRRAGLEKVLAQHTYHHRVAAVLQMLHSAGAEPTGQL